MSKRLGPGIYYDIKEKDYHADPCVTPSLSSSLAKILVNQTPAHAYESHPRLGGGSGSEPSAAMDFGSLVHALVLGCGSEIVVCDYNDWRTNKAKEERDKAYAEGKLPILPKDLEPAKRVATAITSWLEKRGFRLSEGHKEVTIVWEEDTPHGPILCRCRIDWLFGFQSRDLKTCDDANPKKLVRRMLDFGYDIQAEAYTRAINSQVPDADGRASFVFLFAEKARPYPLTIGLPSGSMRQLGASKWQRACELFAECMKTGVWPDTYSDKPVRIEPPAWAMSDLYEETDDE